jgi:hypothetical protein
MTIIDMLRELGIPYKLPGEHRHVSNREVIGIDCPWCSPGEHKYKLAIYPTGTAYCWSCLKMNLVEALVASTDRDRAEVRSLAEEAIWRVPIGHLQAVPRKGRLVLPQGIGPLLPVHKRYLENRGFEPDELVRLWGIQGIDQTGGHLAWRIFIPIHYRGEVVSWTTRTISDKVEPRYRSAPPECEKIHHKDILYGADKAGHAAVIVEGPIDVWAIGPGAVCTFGLSVTQAQIAKIAKYPTRVILFDSEPEAQRAAAKLARELEGKPGETMRVQLEMSADPGSSNPEEIKQLRRMVLQMRKTRKIY